jgi:hypothetical protein
MTSTPTAPHRGRARRELLTVWLVGLLCAAGLGLVAALVRSEQFWLVFGVFTACLLAPSFALAWLLVGAGRRVEPGPHAEENVESRWLEKAAAGALFDLVAAAGVTVGAVSLFDLRLSADVALIGVMAFAVIDGGLRYVALSRRES